MSPLLFLLACVLACEGAARVHFRSPLFQDENSLSPVAKYGRTSLTRDTDWVKIKYSGPHYSFVAPGTRAELECEAIGTPPPSIQWFHNGNPVTEGWDENNSIGELRLGSIRNRLVVDCATPQHHGSYTCVVTSGTKTVRSAPSMLQVGGNESSLTPTCSQHMPSSPRIITWSPNMLETMGNDVTLPCVAVGNPAPQVYWMDTQDNLITTSSADERVKVLDSGELVILSVHWPDMGFYHCVAESPLGRDIVEIFLYPLASGH